MRDFYEFILALGGEAEAIGADYRAGMYRAFISHNGIGVDLHTRKQRAIIGYPDVVAYENLGINGCVFSNNNILANICICSNIGVVANLRAGFYDRRWVDTFFLGLDCSTSSSREANAL